MASTPPISGCGVFALPRDLAGVEVDGDETAPLLLARDRLERAAEPQLVPPGYGGFLDVIGHRLVQVRRIGHVQLRIDRHRRPFDAAVRARQHPRAVLRRQHPHVFLRDHRFGEADQLARSRDRARRRGRSCRRGSTTSTILPLSSFACVRIGGLTASRSHTSCAMYCECHLYVPLSRSTATIEFGVQVVARTDRAVQVGRRIADDEEHRARLQVDRGRHPHAAAERLVERRVLGERRLFRRDVAMHVAAGRVVRRPTRLRGPCRESCRTSTAACRPWRRTPSRSRGCRTRRRWCRSAPCRRRPRAPSFPSSPFPDRRSAFPTASLPVLASSATSFASSVPMNSRSPSIATPRLFGPQQNVVIGPILCL